MEEKLKTGTTTVGIATSNAVVFAADSRATMGFFIASKTAQKIHPISDRMALTIAGSVGDAQKLIRWLRSEVRSYELETQERMTTKKAATLLANVLSAYKYMPFWVQLLLGGLDDKPSIYSIDMVGGVTEERFTATGSGSPIAYGVLETNYKEKMKTEEAVEIAAKAVWAAIRRDAASGEAVNVAVIDKKGFRFVDKKEILKLIS